MDKEFYTAHFDAQVEEKQKPVDSTQVQLDSVMLFMRALGYKRHQDPFNPKPTNGYIRAEKRFNVSLPKFVSFQDAGRLHNGVLMRVVGDDFYDITGLTYKVSFSKQALDYAKGQRLVENVSLQTYRRGKIRCVKVQSHWVKRVK